MVLCAGLIDMPGLGRQWVAGGTLGMQALCHIKCPTSPCWNLPPGASYDFESVTAGSVLAYKSADGELKMQWSGFPVKCACVNCPDNDAACENGLWAEAAKSSSCARPAIQPQAGETFPSRVYGGICRSDEEYNLKGYTGWVGTAGSSASCRSDARDFKGFSVWCPAA